MSKDTVKLASGKQMPLVGFGLWKVPKDTAAETVYNVSITVAPHLQTGQLTSAKGHQIRLQTLRRSVRLPE